ncbi:MAG TPA: MoxR family ATPase [Candidatus Dormibacteraeota bacterium]|nr:MoxR family ATPase [Candidatus Dormibacteraeota bacterium]
MELNATQAMRRLVDAVGTVVVGHRRQVELCVMAWLVGGHVLIEDVPGVGKTLLAKALARASGCQFDRIQFTPDLLPGDITGANVYQPQRGAFEFRPGPVFTQILLADEINRATPKTQSALLEAMEERQVTVDGTTRALPDPFVVLATQNPVDYQGTFALPEAQLDRFLMRVALGYADLNGELEILARFGSGSPLLDLEPVIGAGDFAMVRQAAAEVHVADQLKEYMVRIVQRTRDHPDLALGASARASLGLLRTSQARALLEGRDYVQPDDVKDLAEPVLLHRLVLRASAELQGSSGQLLLTELLESESVPLGGRQAAG